MVRRPSFWMGVALWAAAALSWVHRPDSAAHAFAQAIPVAAASTNPYWAGYVTTSAGPFVGISARWNVPRVSCKPDSPDATAYAWIGEGGYLRGLLSPLIQAGTASDCLGGAVRYHAFYEWYPGSFATDYPVTLNPGDSVQVTIREVGPDYWTLAFADTTSGERSITSALFQADWQTAEFVVERPTVCFDGTCSQVGLAPFGQVTFSSARVQPLGGPAFAIPSAPQSIALDDSSSGTTLAQPARVGTSGSNLSVLWRGRG